MSHDYFRVEEPTSAIGALSAVVVRAALDWKTLDEVRDVVVVAGRSAAARVLESGNDWGGVEGVDVVVLHH